MHVSGATRKFFIQQSKLDKGPPFYKSVIQEWIEFFQIVFENVPLDESEVPDERFKF